MADANQDDTLVFGNNNQNPNAAPQQPSAPRLTVQDLYGPSSSTEQPTPPAQQPAPPVPPPSPMEKKSLPPEQSSPAPEPPIQSPQSQAPQEIPPAGGQQTVLSNQPSNNETTAETTSDQQSTSTDKDQKPISQDTEHPPLAVPPIEESAVPPEPSAPVEQAATSPTEPTPTGDDGFPPPPDAGMPPPPPPQPFPPGINPLHGKLKFILAGIGALILIIGVVAFVLSRGTSGPGDATLNYWGLWEENKTMQVIIDDFEKKYPSIDVVYKKQDPKKYKDRIVTRLTSETGTEDLPDLFTYHNSWLPSIRNVLSPLPNTVITPDEFKNTYYPVIQTDLTVNGAIYGIPQGIDTLNVFINTEMLDAAGLQVPQTWEDFIRTAKTMTVKEKNGKIQTAGAAIGTFDNVKHAPDIASLLMLQNGVELHRIGDFQENIADALIFYTSFAKDSEYVWDNAMNPSVTAFANGEVAMMFGYSWDVLAVKAANPDLVFDIHPVPNLPNKKITIASYWVNGVSNKTKYQKEAMLFMQYLSQKEVAQKLYTESSKTRLFGVPYARTDLATTLKDNPLVYPFVQSADYAASTYFASDTRDTNFVERLNAYLGNAIRAVLSNSSAQSAAATLIQGVQQVRSEFGL